MSLPTYNRESIPLRDIVEWDVASWGKAVAFWEAQGALDGGPLDCLEIGARGGGLTLWMAAHGHRVVCSDVTDTEKRARPLLERYGLAESVTFERINAANIPYENRFDIVAFKSVLGAVGHAGAIEMQRQAVQSMYRALKPGGKLLFAENLVGSPVHTYFRKHFVRWGEDWRYVSLGEMREFLRDFARVSIRTTGFLSAFGRSNTQRSILTGADAALNVVVPERWRYIVYGIASK